MRPEELGAASFAGYPPEARGLAVREIGLLRTLPVPLLAALLREVIELDWRFPAERREVEGQLRVLAGMRPEERSALTDGFRRLALPASLSTADWVGQPSAYLEQLAAALWSTGTMPAYRAAADAYAARMRGLVPVEPPRMPRWCVVVVGQGVEQAPGPLFRRLRPHGVQLTGCGRRMVWLCCCAWAEERAARDKTGRYAHWYIDGGEGNAVPGQTDAEG